MVFVGDLYEKWQSGTVEEWQSSKVAKLRFNSSTLQLFNSAPLPLLSYPKKISAIGEIAQFAFWAVEPAFNQAVGDGRCWW